MAKKPGGVLAAIQSLPKAGHGSRLEDCFTPAQLTEWNEALAWLRKTPKQNWPSMGLICKKLDEVAGIKCSEQTIRSRLRNG